MKIRYALPDDAAACNAFHNAHYGLKRTDDQWAWEFVRPTHSGDLPHVLVIEDGEVVGTQAFIPIPFIDEAGTFMTAKSEETLVAAKMRGKSLFGRMYELLFKYAVDHDYKSIWGFTPAEQAFRKQGFQIPASTRQLFLAISPGSLQEAAQARDQAVSGLRKLALLGFGAVLSVWARLLGLGAARLRFREELIDLEDAALFEHGYSKRFVEAWGGATILRDCEYMQWRIFENPYRRAKVAAVVADGILLGHVAFVVGDDGTGYLVDIMAAHPAGKDQDARIAGILIAEAITRLRRMGASCIRGWTLNEHPFDQLVRRVAIRQGFLFLKRGNAVVFQTAFQPEPRRTSHDDFANWYVTRLFTEGTNG